MKLIEIAGATVKLHRAYRLADIPQLGDYRNLVVYVETGPRGSGKSKQYRVSWGQDKYDVDWIDVSMFDGAKELTAVPQELIYTKK